MNTELILLHLICIRSPSPPGDVGPPTLEETLTPEQSRTMPRCASLALKLRPKNVADPFLDDRGKPYEESALLR